MVLPKIKPGGKSTKDISLSAKQGVYSGLILKNMIILRETKSLTAGLKPVVFLDRIPNKKINYHGKTKESA